MGPVMDNPAGVDLNKAVLDCAVQTQQRLVAGGYEYRGGDPDTWPACWVLLTRGQNAVMVCPIPARFHELAERVPAVAETLRHVNAERRGLIVIGAVDADSADVQWLLEAIKGPVAYLDAVGRKTRTRHTSFGAVGALGKKQRAEFLDPAAGRKNAGVDCHASLLRGLAEVEEAQEFHARIARSNPRSFLPATVGILAVCLVVFGAMVATGASPIAPSIKTLLAWGASYGPDIKAGQWWRLVTSVFVHIGLIHLFFNAYATWILGRQVEFHQGAGRLLAYFGLGALLGGAASLWWTPLVVSAGASGGLFGVLGGLAGFCVRYWGELPSLMRRGLRSALVAMLFYNALFLLVPVIDAAAHVGGFLGGLLMGLVLSRNPQVPRRPGPGAVLAALCLVAATAAFTVWAVRRVPGSDPIRQRRVWQPDRAVEEAKDAVAKGRELLRQYLEALRKSGRLPTQPTTATAPATQPTQPAARSDQPPR